MRQREPPAWAAETDGRALKGGRLSFYRRLGPEQIAKAASARSNGCSQSTRPAGCNAARSTPTSPTLSSPKPAATRSPPSPDGLQDEHPRADETSASCRVGNPSWVSSAEAQVVPRRAR